MNVFKEASKKRLRIETSVGNLSTEQLWDLSITQLDTLAVQLQEHYKESGRKSFVVKTTAKDKLTKLKFDIVLEILTTKMEEADAVANAREAKEHNARIDALIADKMDEELKGKSIKELEKMRK